MWILFLITTMIFLATTVLFMNKGVQAVERAQQYENFFEDTVADLGLAHDQFQELLSKRPEFTGDPDIQNVHRLIAIVHDVLVGYLNVGKQKGKKKKKEEEE